MNPFQARKLTYVISASVIVFPIMVAFDSKHGVLYLAMMIFGIVAIMFILVKYWKCSHCKSYFPLTMSIEAKYCPECGDKIQ